MEMTAVEHVKNIENILGSLKEHCRSEVEQWGPRGKALLSTTADVLEGLEHAFHDFSEIREVNLDEISSKSNEPWD